MLLDRRTERGMMGSAATKTSMAAKTDRAARERTMGTHFTSPERPNRKRTIVVVCAR
jgi:hypothetical protein